MAREHWSNRIDIRVQEVINLIDEIQEPEFLNRVFMGEEITAKLEMDKLIMSGHSMGAATALLAGDQDDRIKCILTHDPWINPIESKFEQLNQCLSKFIQVTTSWQWRIEFHDDD